MTYLFWDTETTGLPDNKRLPDDPSQPYICQIAAILTDCEGETQASFNAIIKPDGWEIPEVVSKIHGVYQDKAIKYGMSSAAVMAIFDRLLAISTMHFAHNMKFDLAMAKRQANHSNVKLRFPEKSLCTMEKAKDIVKMPMTQKMIDAGMSGYKAPSLKDTYKHFFGKEPENQHNAMGDALACKEIYFKIKEQE